MTTTSPDETRHDQCQECLWTDQTPRQRRPRVMFSHDSDEWETPRSLFRMLDKEFGFTLDVCATTGNTTCPQYFTKAIDGLRQDWGTNICWMNPPYSQLRDWLHKAHESSHRGATVVCLTFARTDTRAFHESVAHATEIRFLRGRLRFSNARNTAPAPSCLIIYRPNNKRNPQPVQLTFGFRHDPTSIITRTINAEDTQ